MKKWLDNIFGVLTIVGMAVAGIAGFATLFILGIIGQILKYGIPIALVIAAIWVLLKMLGMI